MELIDVAVEIPMIGTGPALTWPWRAHLSCNGWHGSSYLSHALVAVAVAAWSLVTRISR
jgi:hypothetical protein